MRIYTSYFPAPFLMSLLFWCVTGQLLPVLTSPFSRNLCKSPPFAPLPSPNVPSSPHFWQASLPGCHLGFFLRPYHRFISQTLLFMTSTVGSVIIVYAILIGAYSVIAVQLWQNVHVDGFIITKHTNFQDWLQAVHTSSLMARDFWPQVLLIILTVLHHPSLTSDHSSLSIPTCIPIPILSAGCQILSHFAYLLEAQGLLHSHRETKRKPGQTLSLREGILVLVAECYLVSLPLLRTTALYGDDTWAGLVRCTRL